MLRQGVACLRDFVKRHMVAIAPVQSDEAAVIHIVEAFIEGRPHYAVHLLASLSGLSRQRVSLALFSGDKTSESLKTIYQATILPSHLYPLFEASAHCGLHLYDEYGGPFDSYRVGIAVARVLSTTGVEHIHLSESSWERLFCLLGK